MGSKRQRGLFDFEDRMRGIGEKDPLVRLYDVVDWEAFRDRLSFMRFIGVELHKTIPRKSRRQPHR